MTQSRDARRPVRAELAGAARRSLAVLVAALAIGGTAAAETLAEVLATAYSNNAALAAQRAALPAVDEGVPQALAGWRPTVDIDGSYGKTSQDSSSSRVSSGSQTLSPASASLSLAQPLYRGGRTRAGTRQAEASVLAARADLLATERDTLLATVTAYLDVLRDQAIVRLNRNNEQVLRRQLEATRNRFEVGEITRTDVAQAEARLSRATSDRIQAEGNVVSSRAALAQVTGTVPGVLEAPPPLAGLPASVAEAVAIAVVESPTLLASRHRERASRHAVSAAIGNLLPTISLNSDITRNEDSFTRGSVTESATITARITIPLYQAGAVASGVRQSRNTNNQRRLEIEETRRLVRQQVTQAWERLTTATDRVRSSTDEARAAGVALEGVRAEAEVGLRTTLDTLDAEQELLDARVAVVIAERDQFVAAYEVRASIGRLNSRALDLPVEYYDPAAYYERARRRWW